MVASFVLLIGLVVTVVIAVVVIAIGSASSSSGARGASAVATVLGIIGVMLGAFLFAGLMFYSVRSIPQPQQVYAPPISRTSEDSESIFDVSSGVNPRFRNTVPRIEIPQPKVIIQGESFAGNSVPTPVAELDRSPNWTASDSMYDHSASLPTTSWTTEVEELYHVDQYTFASAAAASLAAETIQNLNELEEQQERSFANILLLKAGDDSTSNWQQKRDLSSAFDLFRARLEAHFDDVEVVKDTSDHEPSCCNALVTFTWKAEPSLDGNVKGYEMLLSAKLQTQGEEREMYVSDVRQKPWLQDYAGFSTSHTGLVRGVSHELVQNLEQAKRSAAEDAASVAVPIMSAYLARKNIEFIDATSLHDRITEAAISSNEAQYQDLVVDSVVQGVDANGAKMYRAAMLIDTNSAAFRNLENAFLYESARSQKIQTNQTRALVGLFLIVGIFYGIADVTTRGFLRGHIVVASIVILVLGFGS